MMQESTGRAGEYLAAFHLEMAGMRTTHVNVIGQDLWVRTSSGRIVSVQVKASVKPVEQDGRWYYDFKQANHTWSAEIYAFAALDLGIVIFEPTMNKRRKLRLDQVTADQMQASISRLFY